MNTSPFSLNYYKIKKCKIETQKVFTCTDTTTEHINTNMKVTTYIDTQLLCGVLDFNNSKKYFVDFDHFNRFLKFDKKFSFINDDDKYPSYLHNYKRYSLLEFIFEFNSGNITYLFKNNDEYDLRTSNVELFHQYHSIMKEKYNIIKYIQGHYIGLGNDAYVMKNPLWKVLNETGEEEVFMYCEKDTLCKLCDKSYQKIVDYEKLNHKKITFYIDQNGYICCTTGLYIHQIITGCYGNGRGTKEISVDHIDQNPKNNCFTNLRIATREEQEQNSKGIKEGTKRARKYNAKPLPEGVTQDMMGKYVCYYEEVVGKTKDKKREFFKIEKHPKLDKIWIGTKSNKVPILQKLATINKVVEDLKNDIYPSPKDDTLPKHITIKVEREKPHLIFDKKDNEGKRLNLRMVLPDNYNLEEQLEIFKEKIKTKYELDV
jgi:hypothetical protein